MGCSPGDSDCHADERPAHRVRITRGFLMHRTEVTVAAYRKFASAAGRSMPDWNSNEAHPVVNVDWNDATAYCRADGGSLPSEAQWEYAARAGSTASRYGPLDDIAWHSGNSRSTHPVGSKSPNRFGLYDMIGNVWEWTSDWYGDYAAGNAIDPKGPGSGGERVVRGGSWLSVGSTYSRASSRYGDQPAYRYINNGFRCVREGIP